MTKPQSYWIDRPMIATWPGRILALVMLIIPDIARGEARDLWNIAWVHATYFGLAAVMYLILMGITRIPRERMFAAIALSIGVVVVVVLADVFLPDPWKVAVLATIVLFGFFGQGLWHRFAHKA